MPKYEIRGKYRGGALKKLIITAPNERAARNAAGDILYGREHVRSVKKK